MAKDSYTLIIVPNASSGLHKVRISLPLLYGIGLTLLLGFFAAVALGFSYAQMALMTADYYELHSENTTLKVENRNLEVATRQLNTKIAGLEELSNKIQDMMLTDTWNQRFGLLDEGGIGGSPDNDPIAAMLASLDVRDHIDNARDRTVDLEGELRFVERIAETRAGKLLSTPSMWPVRGPIRSTYGRRRDPFSGQAEIHRALDIGALYGTVIRAPANGRVVIAHRQANYGNLIVMDHGGGITTRFGHLSRFEVAAGSRVQKGDVIGYVGNSGRSTGPHLHYEVRLNDRPLNPVNYLPVSNSSMAD